MDALKLLMSTLSDQETVSQLGSRVKAKPNQVQQLAELGLPILLGALTRNASTKEGAQSLNRALDQHQDDIQGSVAGFLKNVDTKDGAKILNHLLGSKNSDVLNKLVASTGMDAKQVQGLLTQFAPLILAQLGQQKKQMGAKASQDPVSGLGALLEGTDASGLMGMASKFLDADGDGDITDDVGKMLGKFFK